MSAHLFPTERGDAAATDVSAVGPLWVIFDRDEGSSKPRHVGCAPESGSGMRKQLKRQRLRGLDRSLRQAQREVQAIKLNIQSVRGCDTFRTGPNVGLSPLSSYPLRDVGEGGQ